MMKPKFTFSILFLFFFLFLARGDWLPIEVRLNTGEPIGSNHSQKPQISTSGSNIYVVWQDDRNGDPDIYFNHSTDWGVTWQATDVRLDTGDIAGANKSREPQISSTGTNVYVVWRDLRKGNWDIYFNYSIDGGTTWQSNDTRLDTGDLLGASWSDCPKITSDSGNNVYVVWEDNRIVDSDIYFNYSSDGGATWQATDIRIDTTDFPASNPSRDPQISCLGNKVYIVWAENVNGDQNIYFNYSTDAGTTWLVAPIKIDTGVGESKNPQICINNNNVYCVWSDGRNGRQDIYFNCSTDSGATWPATNARLDTGDDPGADNSWFPQIVSNGNIVYVIWTDRRNGGFYIYFNHSIDRGATWQASDTRLDTGNPSGASWSNSPQIACDNGSNVYAVWEDYRNGELDIYFNFSMNGGVTWMATDTRVDIGDAPGANHSKKPRLACNNNNVYIVWGDERNGPTDEPLDIYFNSYTPSSFILTISASKGGTVRPKPGEHSHIPGTKVKIEAFPNKGYKFSHWSGDVEGSKNPIKFTMDSDKTIKAHFIKQHTLALRSQKGGTTSPSPGSHTFDHGTEVTITAIPESNFRFSNWTGDVLSTENPLTIEMNSNMSITANFVRQYNLTLAAGTGGTTIPPPGTYTYDKGAKVTITAAPLAHHRFSQWTGDLSRTSNPATITMNRDKSITANFSRIIYAPPNFSGQKVSNRSLTQVEYINVLTWQPHPNNVNISKYRIYSIEGETQSLLVEFSANTYQYLHRQVAKDKTYTYILVAVNNEGREGDHAQISVR